MNTLVIHPQDPTTVFLSPIYQPIRNKTVISGGLNLEEVKAQIQCHSRVLMLGHGNHGGLTSVGQFPIENDNIIDASMVDLLFEKEYNIFIWCNADFFVEVFELAGIYTGMFISEEREAEYFEIEGYTPELIDESNYRFSRCMARNIDSSPEVIYKELISDYGKLVDTNPIARYNFPRLYYRARNKNGIRINTF